MIAYLSPFILSSLLQRYYIIRWQIVVVVGAVRVHARQKNNIFFCNDVPIHARKKSDRTYIDITR